MVKRNGHFAQLKSGYLFPEIAKRKKAFLEQHPNAKLISLGIGDTTEPIPFAVGQAIAEVGEGLATKEKYFGYGPEQGLESLREKIAEKFYKGRISKEEIFVSDGAKCDLGRLQILLGGAISVAIQDPAYPVYVDGSVIQGVAKIHMMPCLPENDFFPDLENLPPIDAVYFCSPNNPTGAVSSRKDLEELVAFAKKRKALILFDAAYCAFIQDSCIPQSIFEIEGAKEVAIEINSFSKLAGFTGIRLGWTVVPEELHYEEGTSIRNDWSRLITTLFNGPSILAQKGGEVVLGKGWKEVEQTVTFYLENGRLMRDAFEMRGYRVFGGVNAPYLWVHFPRKNSWEVFQDLLEKAEVVTVPGSGFGRSGEGYIRVSAFGERAMILEAIERLGKVI